MTEDEARTKRVGAVTSFLQSGSSQPAKPDKGFFETPEKREIAE